MDLLISAHFAGNGLLLIFSGLFVFHLLILFGLIPDNLVWAGNLKSRRDRIKMEGLSLLILITAATFVGLKMNYLVFYRNQVIIDGSIWGIFILSVLNTIGNLTAKHPIEKYGFGFLTFLMSLMALKLALS